MRSGKNLPHAMLMLFCLIKDWLDGKENKSKKDFQGTISSNQKEKIILSLVSVS
jgi:hypothetical protein